MTAIHRKINLYILSLCLLFVFIIIITCEFPSSIVELKTTTGWFDLFKKNIVSAISLAMLVYCSYAYVKFRFELNGAADVPFEITSIESVDYEHLTFLATYVVPLISFDFESWRQLLVLGLLLIAMGAIYVKTDLFYANPSLALLGFRIYRIDGDFKTGCRRGVIVICRDKLDVGQKIEYIKLDDRIYFARRARHEH